MAESYLTRVELHNATAFDYQNLHAAMEARKFTRTVPDINGVRYQLPTAEYFSVADIDTNAVLELAKGAVASVGKTASIITVKWTEARWNGLPKA